MNYKYYAEIVIEVLITSYIDKYCNSVCHPACIKRYCIKFVNKIKVDERMCVFEFVNIKVLHVFK